ncbi:hypothetical protein A4A49_28860 [Nicotiana attenuata]|uniref:Uncharacterized protein n=1 Tax=Nicotiana attenuata TaxID=49451 RepID=A0A314KJB9_NICAT|nr:hypothetical protein A4A49_28860 [Nicotiana attenuata]
MSARLIMVVALVVALVSGIKGEGSYSRKLFGGLFGFGPFGFPSIGNIFGFPETETIQIPPPPPPPPSPDILCQGEPLLNGDQDPTQIDQSNQYPIGIDQGPIIDESNSYDYSDDPID